MCVWSGWVCVKCVGVWSGCVRGVCVCVCVWSGCDETCSFKNVAIFY